MAVSPEHEALRAGLDAAMEAAGEWPARSPWIRRAAARLPRELFAPDRLWAWDGDAYAAVERAADPRGWAARVYAGPGSAALTRIVGGLPGSSMSAPAVVADMLDALRLDPGHRVLELGTGTGWNAALLAYRAGAGRVVSVEVDPELAATARERLAAAPCPDVTVVVADGAAGCPGRGPYDRLIATYAVDTIPWAWVEQTRPGGRIVTPWGRMGHVALTVADDGRSASGRVRGLSTFMPARDRLPATGLAWNRVRGTDPARLTRPFARDTEPLRDDPHLLFALRVALPDVQVFTRSGGRAVTVGLHDGRSSWAVLDGGSGTAFVGGPRDLDEELTHAWDHWTRHDEPAFHDFGMTVTPHRQYVWRGDTGNGPYHPAADARRDTGSVAVTAHDGGVPFAQLDAQ
ncbi:methyltransferase domain-containing protein [Streptomyces sp. RFCAC02]|uniref:methyltransferase domain-containing protein n=1 Tax=Streptomyces sp. RFCAC02 TaxID=2499143 RepID=UPI001F0FD9FD|nr:methyltransferase domain-containing protein [Streptomyces sp. RFCAC02]